MRKSYMFALGKSLPFGEVGGALLFYRYDASGERDLKLVGQPMEMWQNGQHKNIAVYDQATLYASGLMTVSERGYTKHYFAEGERIASAIGGGGYSTADPYYSIAAIAAGPDCDQFPEKCTNFENYFVNNWFKTLPAYEDQDDAYGGAWWEDPRFGVLREFFDENGFPYELWYEGTFEDLFPYLLEYRYGISAQESSGMTLSGIVEYLSDYYGIDDLWIPALHRAEWQGISLLDVYLDAIFNMDEDEIYFFHSDHLGSGSVITTDEGYVYQVLSYMPYGETQLDIRNIGFDYKASDPCPPGSNCVPAAIDIPEDYPTPYRFTGHERDEETGFDYAHARYYWSDLGIFTSPDPLAEKYPHLSGYVYCFNNPINAVDPDGRVAWFIPFIVKGAVGAVVDAAAQVSVSVANGQSFGDALSSIDYTSVGASFVTSAITMPGMSTSAKVTTAAVIIADAAIDANMSGVQTVGGVIGDEKSVANVAVDAVSSVLPGLGSGKVTSNFNKAITKDIDAAITKGAKSALNEVKDVVNSEPIQTGLGAIADYAGGLIGGQANKIINGSGSNANSSNSSKASSNSSKASSNSKSRDEKTENKPIWQLF